MFNTTYGTLYRYPTLRLNSETRGSYRPAMCGFCVWVRGCPVDTGRGTWRRVSLVKWAVSVVQRGSMSCSHGGAYSSILFTLST